MRNETWNDAELELLKLHFPNFDREVLLLNLPKRTLGAIQNKARNLGILKINPYNRQGKRPEREIDRVGEKHGKLDIIERIDRNFSQIPLWLCNCDCGEKYAAIYYTIKKVKSCNKCNTKHGGKKVEYCGKIRISLFNYIKKSALSNNLEFTVTVEDLSELFDKQNGKCALSNVSLILEPENDKNASLDRIDSSVGYVKNNIQWLHREVNLLKRDTPNQTFIQMCNNIANKNPVDNNDDFINFPQRASSFWKSNKIKKIRKRSGVLPNEYPEYLLTKQEK